MLKICSKYAFFVHLCYIFWSLNAHFAYAVYAQICEKLCPHSTMDKSRLLSTVDGSFGLYFFFSTMKNRNRILRLSLQAESWHLPTAVTCINNSCKSCGFSLSFLHPSPPKTAIFDPNRSTISLSVFRTWKVYLARCGSSRCSHLTVRMISYSH